MTTLRSALRRHSLAAGLLLMFALSWPIDLAHTGLLPFQVPFAVYLFLGWGFVASALIMIGLTQGRRAVGTLLRRYGIWRAGWRWYAVAFLLYPAIFLIAVSLQAMGTGARVDYRLMMAPVLWRDRQPAAIHPALLSL